MVLVVLALMLKVVDARFVMAMVCRRLKRILRLMLMRIVRLAMVNDIIVRFLKLCIMARLRLILLIRLLRRLLILLRCILVLFDIRRFLRMLVLVILDPVSLYLFRLVVNCSVLSPLLSRSVDLMVKLRILLMS